MSVKSIKSYINLPNSVSCYLNVSIIHSTILDYLPAFQRNFDNQQVVLF